MNKILELKNINKTYKGTSETLHILKDLDLVINEGEFVSIIGKSGSGKSTLLKILIGEIDYKTGIENNTIEGFLSVGSGLKISYVSQDTAFL